MNDSKLRTKRKTPPTNLKNLDEKADVNFPLRGTAHSALVYIDDYDEYYAGNLIGYSAARGPLRGGYILDDYPRKHGEGLVEYSSGKNLYSLHDRYNELLEYVTEQGAVNE